MKSLYLNNRFFYLLFVAGFFYVISFFLPRFMLIPHSIMAIILLCFILDVLFLYGTKSGISAKRTLPEKLSNGDENPVIININNAYFFKVKTKIIDEIPVQFQKRDFLIVHNIKASADKNFKYNLTPNERGNYQFGALNIYASSPIGLISKRYRSSNNQTLPCYPSFIHLRKYELMALQNEFLLGGIKKLRKIGQTTEFEQIKEYVFGDDIRTINWKATSKQNKIMVNQYQEEKAQRIVLVIDKGRTMQMPFKGMSLLDYSINTVMALSQIILKKGDRAGMMTFSKKPENKVPADHKTGQLKKISEALFNIKTNFYESDFSRLYQDIRLSINQRSLILLFTNFETLDAVNRQMKSLRSMAKNHLLVVVFFKNSELQQLIHTQPENMQAVYDKIIAEKLEFEKQLIIQELKKYGIYSLYTEPENLTIESINKYLEIKARGIL